MVRLVSRLPPQNFPLQFVIAATDKSSEDKIRTLPNVPLSFIIPTSRIRW
jgi:hypothetical protein